MYNTQTVCVTLNLHEYAINYLTKHFSSFNSRFPVANAAALALWSLYAEDNRITNLRSFKFTCKLSEWPIGAILQFLEVIR